jgi:hypothetical protein
MQLCANYQKHFVVRGRDVAEQARPGFKLWA